MFEKNSGACTWELMNRWFLPSISSRLYSLISQNRSLA